MIAISAGIKTELSGVAEALLFGAFLAAVYDLMRVFRRIAPRGIACVSAEDILYWTAAGIAACSFLYRVNSGGLRAYFFGGMAAGAFLYHRLIGRWLIAGISRLLCALKKELKKRSRNVTMKKK